MLLTRGEPDSGPENAGLSGIFGGPKPVRRPAKNRPDFRTFKLTFFSLSCLCSRVIV